MPNVNNILLHNPLLNYHDISVVLITSETRISLKLIHFDSGKVYVMAALFSLVFPVMKMKFRRAKKRVLYGRKVKTVFKTWRGTPDELRRLRKPKLKLRTSDECCSEWLQSRPGDEKYMVMGRREGRDLVATFILPWTRDEVSLKITILETKYLIVDIFQKRSLLIS